MARRRQIFEGRAKILFEGPEPGTLVQYFKDEAAPFSPHKRVVITGKGVLNNRISEYLMTKLGEIGIPNHFVRRLNMREQLVREVEMIPIQVIIRNVANNVLDQGDYFPDRMDVNCDGAITIDLGGLGERHIISAGAIDSRAGCAGGGALGGCGGRPLAPDACPRWGPGARPSWGGSGGPTATRGRPTASRSTGSTSTRCPTATPGPTCR